LDDAATPSDGTEDDGHGVGAEVAAPAVDEGSEGAGVIGEGGIEMTVDVFGD